MGKRNKPADPQAILLRRAKERAAARARERNPGDWGVSAELIELTTSDDVSARLNGRGKVISARRSDAFALLHQAKRYDEHGTLTGGISDLQHKASRRYVRDWTQRMGVSTVDPDTAPVDEQTDGQGRVQRMIDAGRRIDAQHARIGPTARAVLVALVEPMMRGEVRPWRALVQAATGETTAHGQASRVRGALEELRIAQDQIDGVAPAADGPAPRQPVRLWFAE